MAAARRCSSSSGHVFLVGPDVPDVPERVLDGAGPVAIELVLHGLKDLRSFRHGGLHGRVDVGDVQHDADRRAAELPRSACAHLRVLIGQHDDRITDADLRMPDFSARPGYPHALGRGEDPLVEVERARRAVDDHVRRGVVISVRHRLHFASRAHRFPPCVRGACADASVVPGAVLGHLREAPLALILLPRASSGLERSLRLGDPCVLLHEGRAVLRPLPRLDRSRQNIDFR